jgi:hypothetical protein
VSDQCTVLIAAPALLSVLKERAAGADASIEILSFADSDALRALETIAQRKPPVIALDRMFASTPRGAALVNRIKADPSLVGCEIRVVSTETDYNKIAARRPEPAAAMSGSGGGAVGAATAAAAEVAAPMQTPSLDHYGTRRAPRFKVSGTVDVLIDGNTGTLVDVSTAGAQVLTPAVLKPNQRIRMALPEDGSAIRFNATVIWAKFEIPPHSGPHYRAGIEFIDASASALDAYCARHKG